MRRTILVALFLLLPLPLAAQERRAFTPADWYRVTHLSNPAMSPDGQHVAFTVQTVNEDENERHREVWMVPVAGGEPVRLTAPGYESSNPRWSEDGRLLYFSSNRPGGRGNSWALRMDAPGEAFQPEDEDRPNGSTPADESFYVFTRSADADTDADADSDGPGDGGQDGPRARGEGGERPEDPFARMPATARPPFGAITTPLDVARFDGRHIVDGGYKRNGPGFVPNRREAPPAPRGPSQLWRKNATGDTSSVQLTRAPYSVRGGDVSPDGRWILYSADAALRPDSVVEAERDSIAALPYDPAHEENRNDSDLFLLPATGGEPQRLGEWLGNERGITWSPDSRRIAFTSSTGRTAPSRLYVVDARPGAEPRDLLGDWPYEPGSVEWREDGKLWFTVSIGGRSALMTLDPRTGERTQVVGGRRQLRGVTYDADFTRMTYVATRVDAPTELYVADIDGSNERRLTGFNDELTSEVAFSDAERFTFESVDGFEIEGWMMKPYGYEEGREYPLVLYIHGGPHSQYGEGWFDEFQNIAGAGMWVLFTNPRGSSGYGADFTYSTRGRWGLEDYEDLMKAVDIAAARPDVDEDRMGVTGGSYGGFMTAWITTRTDRFKAAQADRMISNWVSWWGSTDVPTLTEFEFFGRPWEQWELYESLSPMTFVGNATTPTLIVQSEEDHRTPMNDAELWFQALDRQDVPVEFVRYPRSTHDLSRTGEPWLLVDRLARLRQWFSHWLDGPEKPAVTAESAGL
ncbi:MAG: S9 family peptidase [Gemmatimonadota bacterium]